MTGNYHTVKQGECLYSIGRHYGFRKWESIYLHENNQELRERRPDPNCLNPGDRVFIPEKNNTPIRPSVKMLTIKIPNQTQMFRIKVRDVDGNPWQNVLWKLTVNEILYEGTADSNGLIEQEIEATKEPVVLRVFHKAGDTVPATTWYVNTGYLDPVETTTGVQARLKNLGYYSGKITGETDQATTDAIKQFQKASGMEPTGQVCEQTRKHLVQ